MATVLAGERRTVRGVAGIETGDGRIRLVLELGEASPGPLVLELPLPAGQALLRGLLAAVLERWPDPGLPAAPAPLPGLPVLEPVAYGASAIRVRATTRPRPLLQLTLRNAHAGPLRVTLEGSLGRPLLAHLQQAVDWLEAAEATLPRGGPAAAGRPPPPGGPGSW